MCNMLLALKKEAGKFGFIGRRSDKFDDCAMVRIGPLKWGIGASLEMKM